MKMAPATATRGRKTAKAVKSAKGKTLKLVVGEFRGKEKEIDVSEGTTVAEAVRKAGYSVPDTRTAEEEDWRLNGHHCNWTDKITGKNPSLYQLDKVQAGKR
jgi:hypothetical protein